LESPIFREIKEPRMREPQLGVAVGKKGVGKSYTTNILLQQYVNGNPAKGVQGRRALILDVNDEFTHVKAIGLKDIVRFSVHPQVELRRIRPFLPDGRRMTLDKIAETLFVILEQFKGGLLLIEDINRYVSDHLPKDIEGAICTNRHIDLDIIMHFQSIGRITTKIWQNCNWMRFHKNLDSVDRHANKFEDKHEFLRLVEGMVNNEYQSGNKRFYQYVNLDEMKMMGFVDQKKLDVVIEEYIMMNQRKLIRPYLNMKNESNKAKYTMDDAKRLVKTRLIQTYT
jgi:hypothetical protein